MRTNIWNMLALCADKVGLLCSLDNLHLKKNTYLISGAEFYKVVGSAALCACK